MMYPFCAKNEMKILVSPINQIDITKQCRYNRTFLCSTFTRLIRLAPTFSRGKKGNNKGRMPTLIFVLLRTFILEGRIVFLSRRLLIWDLNSFSSYNDI